MAERHVVVQRVVLEARGRLDRGDDLPRHAELRKAAERRLLVGTEVANRLAKADQALLHEILAVAAGQEVRARLHANEARVPPDQRIARKLIAVARLEDKLQILKLSLSLKCCFLHCGCWGCT